jgi:ABC-type transport system substrate-binding protein
VVDSLLEQARVETDETKRFLIYNEVEQTILDDAPWIPLWYSGERYLLIKPNVKDYLQTPLIIPKLRHVYLTDE